MTMTEPFHETNPMENALVLTNEGGIISWHLPLGRTAGFLPDSRPLWDVLWEHRAKGGGNLGGVAHTHPWLGTTGYSQEDVTTFAAVETGLGQRLVWPIATFDHLHFFVWQGPGRYHYVEVPAPFKMEGLDQLRILSGAPEVTNQTL